MTVPWDDINNDGQADMIFITNIFYGPSTIVGTKLYAYTFPGVSYTHENFPWPMYGHDRYRTFNYDFFPDDEHVGIQIINNEIPGSFELHQNYLNPFNNSTIIEFDLNTKSNIELNLFSVDGRLINTFFKGLLTAGTYHYNFKNDNLASGVYIYSFHR